MTVSSEPVAWFVDCYCSDSSKWAGMYVIKASLLLEGGRKLEGEVEATVVREKNILTLAFIGNGSREIITYIPSGGMVIFAATDQATFRVKGGGSGRLYLEPRT